jgi:leucyl-tRNA synthetase
MPRYNPATIEPKWQQYWEANRTFAAPRLPQGPKSYVLDMFPYPSGDGLHVGHPEGYTATDIVCRYRRMKGQSVMHPMGWDAFGLPAEQHARKTGTPPRTTTERNIANFRRQLQMLGFSYDWSRELATTDPDYFRWTQFIFLVLFDTWFDAELGRGRPIAELPIPAEIAAEGSDAIERYCDFQRLAYQIEAPVNWCPALGTVLANEEVIGGVSERGGHPVVRIPLRQWMLRITAYADRLEKDLDGLDWPESIKLLQRNWIGRSQGAEVDFFIGTFLDPDADKPGYPPLREYHGWRLDRSLAGFPPRAGEEVLRVYTTRPDTLFGATYMVLAPEHPLVGRLTSPEQAAAVAAYCEGAARKSDLERTDLAKAKTGVFTGSYAINPVNDQPIPIWVADYVLASYGTGAIMAVPAHDTRDFEFAKKFGLPILEVVADQVSGVRDQVSEKPRDCIAGIEGAKSAKGELLEAFVGEGRAIHSGPYDGLPTPAFIEKITCDLWDQGRGRAAVNYKLRDWLFSRQHFWGEPFPVLHELDAAGAPTGRVRALRPEDLPLDLPEHMTFDAADPLRGYPDRPEPPLEKAPDDWLYVTLDGRRYRRETNTMPQWAGSCWYYLRFLDPRNRQALVDPEVEQAWMPVDLYVGGAEHAVLHLLYARFWHKVLFDRGYVSTSEPFRKLVNQGMILGQPKYYLTKKPVSETPISADEIDYNIGDEPELGLEAAYVEEEVPEENVDHRRDGPYLKDTKLKLTAVAEKMSKSRGNVVNPDQVVAEYGADSLRLYEMFMGPLEAVKPWSMEGVSGVRGFLDRAWRMIVDDRAEPVTLNEAVCDAEPTPEQNRALHKMLRAVTRDIESLGFNTAIARMMEFTNFFLKEARRPRSAMERFVLALSPFAPHLAEDLWQALGHQQTLAYEPWPAADEAWLREDTVEVPVQVNGKLRGRTTVAAAADAAAIEAAARADTRVAQFLAGKTLVKVVVVPGRLINFVVK